MKDYMSRAEIVNEILLGVGEIRYYRVNNINTDYGKPCYLYSLSYIELERIYKYLNFIYIQIVKHIKYIYNFKKATTNKLM